MPGPSIFLLAGEASGDALGSKLMTAIFKATDNGATFHGVGGPKMQALGLKSLFPMEHLSIVGFVEIIPHIPRLLGYIKEAAYEIERLKPDVVVTIDAPAFNFRVVERLRKDGYSGKIIHYVAPSVWAYKPERARRVAAVYDHVLALLPFEPPYFEKARVDCTYVGHPVVEEPFAEGAGAMFRAKHHIDHDVPVLCLMPGSRKGELKRHLPIFAETVRILSAQLRDLHCVVIATPQTSSTVLNATKDWFTPTIIVAKEEDKIHAMAACNVALVKSGTSTLEAAMAELPMVVAYRANPISAYMLKKMIQVKYVSIINLIMKEEVIPELLQENCTPHKLALAVEKLYRGSHIQLEQHEKAQAALHQLGLMQDLAPSDKAAQKVLEFVKR